jgi:hypothetical protein
MISVHNAAFESRTGGGAEHVICGYAAASAIV